MKEANTPPQDTHGPQPGRSVLSGNVAHMGFGQPRGSCVAPLRSPYRSARLPEEFADDRHAAPGEEPARSGSERVAGGHGAVAPSPRGAPCRVDYHNPNSPTFPLVLGVTPKTEVWLDDLELAEQPRE
jgi:hypothetical protein